MNAHCDATIRYYGQDKHVCTLPAGHEGPHCAQTKHTPLIWTATVAPAQPRSW